ncbi:MAG TPA: hypothetical protein VJU77_11385 [Chthoniobacterales bacterium]|nr:hypothetical protein [Chthoniobacterales bacterium]
MKLHRSYSAVLFLFALPALAGSEPPLKLARTIHLPGVEGRIDHLAFDSSGKRLFVCALGNNSVEVIDLAKGEKVRSITGLGAPQGVAYLADSNRLVVANDEGGRCTIYDAKSFQPLATVDLKDDADNIRYDSAAHQVLAGFGSGGIAIIDPTAGKQLGAISLPAHPESFQFERNGPRIFVNVPSRLQVAVLDRDQRKVVARWRTDWAASNFPMALDETNHRLFVGCRAPAKLLVLNTDSGEVVSKMEIAGDSDDLFYDNKRHHVYAICGAGRIDVIAQSGPDSYQRLTGVDTAEGARTGLFVPELDTLFVAVPHKGSQPAGIRAYDVRD